MKRWLISGIIGLIVVLLGTGIYFYNKARPGVLPLPFNNASVSQGTSATSAKGWLHTAGTKIVDSGGSEYRIASININDFNKGSEGCIASGSVPDQQTIDNVHNIGFNAIRLNITWGHLEPTVPTKNPDGTLTHHWNEQYLSNIDETIKKFSEKNITTIISMHVGGIDPELTSIVKPDKAAKKSKRRSKMGCVSGFPEWSTANTSAPNVETLSCNFYQNKSEAGELETLQNGFTEALKNVAARYANNQNVIGYDMINEPYPHKGSVCTPAMMNLDGVFLTMSNALRAVNPNALLIFEDASSGAAKNGDFTLKGPIPLPNVVYSFHLYHQLNYSDGKKIVDAFWNRAKQWNIPLWMGEFGAYGYQAPGVTADQDPNWKNDTEQTLQYLKAQGISWGVSSYSGGNTIVNKDGSLRQDLIDVIKTGF